MKEPSDSLPLTALTYHIQHTHSNKYPGAQPNPYPDAHTSPAYGYTPTDGHPRTDRYALIDSYADDHTHPERNDSRAPLGHAVSLA